MSTSGSGGAVAEPRTTGGMLRGLVPQPRRRLDGGASRRDARALAEALGAFPELAACRPADLEALAGAGRVTTLPARWTLLHEGTPADACYILLRGQVEVLRGGVKLAVLGPGSLLGEMALLGRSLRRASIVTATPVQLLRLEHESVAALVGARPHLAACVDAAYARHRAADAARLGR